MGGRIHNADAFYEMRHPIALPKLSPLAHLIMKGGHQIIGHQGNNTVFAKIREKYWIFGANPLVKRISRECCLDRKHYAKPCEEIMTDLLDCRLNASGAPFENVGMNYFGSFLIKRG